MCCTKFLQIVELCTKLRGRVYSTHIAIIYRHSIMIMVRYVRTLHK